MPNVAGRLKPKNRTVDIRCYGQGLGDCFLLAFPNPNKPATPFYVVIDCGVAHGTPDEEARMQAVVTDIRDATGGRLDVLAVTHQHYDHVIGFAHAEALWKEFKVDRIFAPWTEKPNDPDAATVGKAALRLAEAANAAAEQAAGLPPATNPTSLQLTGGLLPAGSESFGISAAKGIELGWKVALSLCPEERKVYCEPGDVLPLGDTGVKAYVLGPPRLKDRDGNPLVGRTGKPLVFLLEDRQEMYSYEQFGLTPDGAGNALAAGLTDLYASAETGDSAAVASALLAGALDNDASYDGYCPFDPAMQIGWDDAMEQPFFSEHYDADESWRRIDDDWLEGASDMALRAGDFTNNISLVLAFELPHTRKVLLFVGDAQVGNWLSWHEIGQWRPHGEPLPSGPADMDDLLGRVTFYKVGHHGSHNATIRDQGLEKMQDGLVAYIPVSVPVAHDIMGYCPMPFYPVLLALQKKARGAVFLANGKLLEPLPEGADRDELEQKAVRSTAMLGPKVRATGAGPQELEGAVPLWTQFTLAD